MEMVVVDRGIEGELSRVMGEKGRWVWGCCSL